MQRPLMLAFVSAIAFGFAAAAPASAQDFVGPDQRVSYSDLNLDHRAGALAMLQRLERATARACGDRVGTIPLAFRVRIERCIDEKMSQAVAEVGHSGLSSLYYGRNPEIIVASR
jgi:UrcA family protein